MSLRIIYEDKGMLHIVIPAAQWIDRMEELAQKVIPEGISSRIVDANDIPSDRYFRDAWKDLGTFIDIDMPMARDIHMDIIRRERDKELSRLDIEQLKGNDVSAEKQILRDIPGTFDLSNASTSEELKALWPEEIPRQGE